MDIHKSVGTLLLACAGLATSTAAVEPPATQPAASTTSPAGAQDGKISALVRQLGDDSYQARQEAVARLREIGKPAVPALKKAAASSDPEVHVRASELLEQLVEPTIPLDLPQPHGSSGFSTSVRVSINEGGRVVDANENGRSIHIELDARGIRMKVSGWIDGAPATRNYNAESAEQLRRANPEACDLYEHWAGMADDPFLRRGMNANRMRRIRPVPVAPLPPLQIAPPGTPHGDDIEKLERNLLDEMRRNRVGDDQRHQVLDLLQQLRDVDSANLDPADVDKQMEEYNRRSDALRKELKDLKLSDPGDALPPPASGRLGISAQEETVEGGGLSITHVLPESRAQKIGLKEADVIQKVNGKEVHSTKDLRRLVSESPKGIVVEGLRDGQALKLTEEK